MTILGVVMVLLAWAVLIGVIAKENRDLKHDREARAAWIEGLGLKRVK